MAVPLDRARLLEAFEALGADLAAHGRFVERAVYGGGALMLQFAWRRSTEDVDAVVRAGYDEAVLAPSVLRVAERMGLEPEWLNDAVGVDSPLHEDETLFALSGTYPARGTPGLRTRLIFTGPDPLQRARFPRDRGMATMPLDHRPGEIAR